MIPRALADERSLDVLDFGAVRALVAKQTMTDRATARAAALVPQTGMALARREQAATAEMRRIVADGGFALARTREVGEAVALAARGGTLGAEELREIGLALASADAAVRRVRGTPDVPTLLARCEAAQPLPEIAAAIDRAIGERGDVLDRASATLARLIDGRGVESDVDILKSAAHQVTGLNLCALGDSIEPFLGSVLDRFEDQFRAYVRKTGPVPLRVAV